MAAHGNVGRIVAAGAKRRHTAYTRDEIDAFVETVRGIDPANR